MLKEHKVLVKVNVLKDPTSLNKCGLHPEIIKSFSILFGPVILRSAEDAKDDVIEDVFPLSVDMSLKSPQEAVLYTSNERYFELFNDRECLVRLPDMHTEVSHAEEVFVTFEDLAPEYHKIDMKKALIRSYTRGLLLRLEYLKSGSADIEFSYNQIKVKASVEVTALDSNAKFVRLNNSTQITFSDESLEASIKVPRDKIGGYASVLDTITKIFAIEGNDFKVVLLYGAEGTGKTHIGKFFANHIITPESFSEAGEIFKKCKTTSDVVLVDDIDDMGSIHDPVNKLVKLIHKSSCRVLITARNVQKVQKSILKLVGKLVEVEAPDPETRYEIMSVLLSSHLHSVSEKVLREFALNSHGYVAADFAALVKETYLAQRLEQSSLETAMSSLSLTERKITITDLMKAKSIVRPSAMKQITLDIPNVPFSSIGGQSRIKQSLQESILGPLKNPEKFAKLGISPPKGILLYGPPGCSKTMLAKALATEAGLNFFAVKGPEVFNMWLGESEKAVRDLFTKARKAKPSIIFLDEIDSIAGTRGNSSSSGGAADRVLTTLLVEMDGIESLEQVTIVAATNRPDVIDPALKRPGRLDRILYVPPPDREARTQIFEIQKKKSIWSDDVSIETIVNSTEGWTGAECVNLCREAAMMTIRNNCEEVKMGHFNECLKNLTTRLTREMIESYENYAFNGEGRPGK